MLSPTTFIVVNILYLIANLNIMYQVVKKGLFRKLYIFDYLLAVFFNAIYLSIMYTQRPLNMQNSSMKMDYLSYGSTAIDGVYGRKYRYDLLVDKNN